MMTSVMVVDDARFFGRGAGFGWLMTPARREPFLI
jgi:hypothetical protein